MIQKSGIMFLLLMAVVITAGAVDLDREGRDPAYVESIVKRSQKIVDKLELTDTVAAREVTTIIANRYFKLNDIYARCQSEAGKRNPDGRCETRSR